MYQFVVVQGVPLPSTIYMQYMRCAIPLETYSSVAIRQHHESIMLVMPDADTEIEGNFAILDQLSDKVTGGLVDSSKAETTTDDSLDLHGKEINNCL